MALVAVEDVEALSGESFDDDTFSLATVLIPLIQGDMEGYLGRALEPRAFTNEIHLLPIDRSFVYLKNTPVQSVQSISVNGFPLQATWFFVNPMGITLYGNAWGFGYGFAPVGANVAAWLSPTATFLVSYTGGLDTSSDPQYQVLRHILIRTILEQITIARQGDTLRAGYMRMRVQDYNWERSELAIARMMGGVSGTTGVVVAAGPFAAGDMALMNRFKRRVASS